VLARGKLAILGRMMVNKHVCSWVLAASLAAGISAPVSGQTADPLASFYAGRAVNLVIGFSPGGGYDAYARVLARHLGKHIPGHPKIIVKNMPGAGGTIAANYVFNVSPKDGSEIGLFAGNVAIDPLLGGAPVKYDARKFGWLGSPYSDTSLCISWHTSPFRTVLDTLQNEMVTGAFGNAGTDFPTALNNVVGTKMKLVKGYPGSNAVKLALERGEVQGGCGFAYDSLRATSPDWLKEKKVHLLVQIALRKDPRLPDVPFVMDLAKSEEDRQILQLIFGWLHVSRPIAAPPDVPADRLAAMRRAFNETMRDPEFRADAEKIDIDLDPLPGEEIERFLDELYRTPKSVIERAATLLERKP
jgi:tripartite-type tricarboxylate transporter receptor subunit TctC